MIARNITFGAALTTSSQDVYTTPAYFKADVESIVISNKTGATTTFTLQWYSLKNNTDYPLFFSTTIDPYASIQLTQALYLDAGDKVKAYAGANNAVTVSVKVAEAYDPTQKPTPAPLEPA